MHGRLWQWFVSACLALAMVACSPLWQKPEIELLGVELTAVRLTEQQFTLKLKVRNPNSVDLVLKRLDFSVELDGRPFAQGAAAQPLRIQANGDAVLEVHAVSRLAALLERVRAARSDGREKITYRIFGSVDLENVGILPFERRGELPSFCPGCAPANGRNGSSKDDRPL